MMSVELMQRDFQDLRFENLDYYTVEYSLFALYYGIYHRKYRIIIVHYRS